MKKKKLFKKVLWTVFIVFVIMNTIAFFHAYKFTHFDQAGGTRIKDARQLSFTQKLGLVLFGVDNPRPQNKTTPKDRFETIKLKSNKEIECWLIKTAGAKGTVVMFHGYGGEKSSMLEFPASWKLLKIILIPIYLWYLSMAWNQAQPM